MSSRSQAIDLATAVVSEFKPSPKLPTAEFFERHVVLENGQPWRMWKPQRQIAEALDDPHLRNLVIKSSARVGKTQTLKGILLRGVARGLNVGLIQARREDAIDFSNSTFRPAAAKCPPVAALMRRSSKSRGRVSRLTGNESRDTTSVMTFTNGGSARFLSAESPGDARRISLDVALFDESSGYAAALGEEGCPIALFSKRTGASYRPLRVITSTPAGEGCHVAREFELTDKRRFFVSCIECGHDQTLEYERLVVNPGGQFVCDLGQEDLRRLQAESPSWSVEYACSSCGCTISERNKRAMIEAGIFRPTAVAAVPGSVGFEFNAMISRFESASWRNIAIEGMSSRGSPEKEVSFWNTTLGRSYSTSLDKGLTSDFLAQNFAFDATDSEGRLDPRILQVCAGCDIQNDRAEITFLGRMLRNDGIVELVILDHHKVDGDPTTPQLFDRIEEQVQKPWPSQLGGQIEVDLVAVDSGAWTTHVYEACHAPGRGNWRAIKGSQIPGRPMWQISKTTARWTDKLGRLFIVGVDATKTTLMQMLSAKPEHRRIRIARHLCGESAYLEQLVAEERVIIPGGKHKRAKIAWRSKPGVRSEGMDCFGYSLAAMTAAGIPDWDKRREGATAANDDSAFDAALADIAKQLGRLGDGTI